MLLNSSSQLRAALWAQYFGWNGYIYIYIYIYTYIYIYIYMSNSCAMCWHSRRGFFFWENDVPGNFRHVFCQICCFLSIFGHIYSIFGQNSSNYGILGADWGLSQVLLSIYMLYHTLHVIIIPGVGQTLKLVFGTPPGQPKLRLSSSDTCKW